MIGYSLDDNFHASDVKVIRDSGKALLVEQGGDEFWIPQSQVHDDSEVWKVGQDRGTLAIAGWLARREGWAE